jgi:hypothetical protein
MVGKLLIEKTLDLWSNSHGVICWHEFYKKIVRSCGCP